MAAEKSDLSEVLEPIDLASWMDTQAIDYRSTRGSRGMQLNVKTCPVCGNDKWKVYLNEDSGLGNCFGGSHPPGENFNKFSFIRASLGVDNKSAVDHIKTYAMEQGWRPPKKSKEVVDLNLGWQMPNSYGLPMNGKTIPYLANRGFGPELAAYFHWRYAPDKSWFKYVGADGNPAYQNYARRILVPIYDLNGKLATFQGRDTTGTADKKYLFPPGIEAAGAHLYNGFNVAVGTKRVVVGEGVFDVAALKIALDSDPQLRDVVPVGTFGKHLSAGDERSQVAKFKTLKSRGVEEVTFMWDGEIQATDDALAAGRLLQAEGFRVRIGMLPFEKDPNEVPPAVSLAAFYRAELLTPVTAIKIALERRKSAAMAGK